MGVDEPQTVRGLAELQYLMRRNKWFELFCLD